MLAEVEVRPKSLAIASSDAFSDMCAALGLANESLIVVLTVYLDESYNQPTVKNPNDPLVYTVGGWVSTAHQWKKFGKQWRAALRSAGVEWFHMSEYESRIGDYQHWSDFKRVGVLKRLHRIIKDHTVYGVTVSVNRQAYDEVVTNDLRPTFGKTCYGFNVGIIMAHLGEWINKTSYTDSIHYVFAELKGQGGELDKLFRELLNKPGHKEWLRLNGMWTKGFMRDVMPLQAADIVAYELNKRSVNHVSKSENFIRKSLQNLGSGMYGDRLAPLYFGKNELIKLLQVREE